MSKPLVIMDRVERVLISSIAAYSKATANDRQGNHCILVTLKSGQTATLEYGPEFLRDEVFDWLDSQFDVPPLEVEPCERCSRKDQPDPQYSDGATYCNNCAPDWGYDQFKHKEESDGKSD